MKYIPLMLFFCALSISSFAHAQTDAAVPRPPLRPEKQMEREKRERERNQEALKEEGLKISLDLNDTKKQLVETASKVKENEAVLNALDRKIKSGREEQDAIQKRLKKEKGAIGDLVLALERINRTPPEAIIAKPGAPLETAQSALLLQSILPDIYGRAENLKKDVARLGQVIASLEKDQTDVTSTSEKLAAEQKELATLLNTRKKLYDKNRSEYEADQKALLEVSARAQTLKDLVARIEQREREAAEERTVREKAARLADAVRPPEQRNAIEKQPPLRSTPVPKDGYAQLPVSGMIKVGYRQTDDIGAESQGLTIEGRPGALVVSPMGGVVRYAGNFKSYGRIIIVEHQKDYHSLIAGLARIDTVVGQSVAAGEPVGVLSKTSRDGGRPILYYELRLNGEPVNPARKFAGL